MGATTATPGPCIWCSEWVTDKREESGASSVDWATEDGDFGCDRSPETVRGDGPDAGTGNHARPSDAAQWLAREEAGKALAEAASIAIGTLEGLRQGFESAGMKASADNCRSAITQVVAALSAWEQAERGGA